MPNTEAALQYGLALRGKICYSMSNRLGAGAMDCSSFVFRSLIAAGLLPKHTAIGNTETLFGLNGTLLKEITRQEVRRGDLWVAGHEGASLGSAGHCGWFLGNINGDALHCTYSKGCQNIAVTKAIGWMGDYSGLPVRYFRVNQASIVGQSENSSQQRILAIDGSWGPATTRRLQEVLNCAIKDGNISGQIKKPCKSVYSIRSVWFRRLEHDSRAPSLFTCARRRKLWSCHLSSIAKRMGTKRDGLISPVSDCVKVLQDRLNKGRV